MTDCCVPRSTLFRQATSQETFPARSCHLARIVAPVLVFVAPIQDRRRPRSLVTSARGALASRIPVRCTTFAKRIEDCAMTVADITLAMFTICNSLRVLAYAPQIVKAATDRGGVEAIS